ncbi:uncharacterized protein LOC117121190 isoform X2 [Anneissia japonica]|nr:uncharacterized protein LOC117121190 isoform X2 [Anneissia japonica]XP_033122194.1 uncharacterized protein LOC117121190 isoform X2 [Anneissia japonica]XP_033122195.1 uncharacterized protein LOC117121190 isoform X2 [Anneissia japonica]
MSQKNGVCERYDDIVEKWGGKDAAGVIEMYDEWAETYERDALASEVKHTGRELLVEALQKIVTDKSVRILDFAAGTGVVGELAMQAGFTNIDALDGSEKCLEIARGKNVYKNLITELVGDDQLKINEDTYDVVTCCGGFTLNHLTPTVIPEWIRITKPGGYIFNSFRHRWLNVDPTLKDGKLEKTIRRLEDEGKWKLIETTLRKGQANNTDSILFVHQKC